MPASIPVRPYSALASEARATLARCGACNARLAARRITQFLSQRMDSAGLSVPQFALLANVAVLLEDSLGALAGRAGLDPSTLSRNLHVLEREGLVEIAADERDTRRRAVRLTERGAQRLTTAMAAWRSAHGELERRIDVSAILKAAEATEPLEGL